MRACPICGRQAVALFVAGKQLFIIFIYRRLPHASLYVSAFTIIINYYPLNLQGPFIESPDAFCSSPTDPRPRGVRAYLFIFL